MHPDDPSDPASPESSGSREPDDPNASAWGESDEPGWEERPSDSGWDDGGGGETEGPPPDDADETGGPSWEYQDQLGFITAATRTIGECLFRPGETFASARRKGGMGRPLLFTLIVGSMLTILASIIGTISMTMFQTFASSMTSTMSGGSADIQAILMQQVFPMMMGTAVNVFLAPIAAVIGPLWNGLIAHLFLMLFRGARYEFEATYRCAAYCSVSTTAIALIPGCGGLISAVWYWVVMSISLAQMHRTDTWRAVCAVLAPVVLAICCFGGVGAILFAVAAMAAAGAGGAPPFP